MDFLNRLQQSFTNNALKNALYINDVFYSYQDLSNCIVKIRKTIQNETKENEKLFGLIANNDLETYASIFALWFENKAYIPVTPSAPRKRNNKILKNASANYVFDSSKKSAFTDEFKVFSSSKIASSAYESYDLEETEVKENNIAYILFTSGTTGKPKGIPISFKNLDTLLMALNKDSEYKLNASDKCLQMYDLTFDASLTAFMPAFLAGACSYTIPSNTMKYFQVFKLLVNHKLTVIKMVPAIIHYLRPYFPEINATSVRYCIFGGGKLEENIIKEWVKCIPNSKLYNHYGPTECTVCSTYYTYKPKAFNKTHNGILSIGKPLNGMDFMLINATGETVKTGIHGELCLAGNQLTEGYWRNKQLTASSFFFTETNGNSKRFYKTGDICYLDSDGDLMYVERKDFQVKIRGFRIELGEIEYYVKQITDKNTVVIDVDNLNGNNEIALVIEGGKIDTNSILSHLQSNLPNYMIPTQTHFVTELPFNNNGKLDRKQLRTFIQSKK